MNFVPRPIAEVASDLGLTTTDYEPYGRGKAKLGLALLQRPPRGKGRLVLVTAINPTPAGEGKTTTSISLAMGMRRLGKNAVLIVEFADETARLAAGFLSVFHAGRAVGHRQQVLRAGDSDVEQPPFLVLGPFRDAAGVRKKSFL